MIKTASKITLITLFFLFFPVISHAANEILYGKYCSSRMVCYTLEKNGIGMYYFKGEDTKIKYIIKNHKLYGKFFFEDGVVPEEADMFNYFGDIINKRTFYHKSNDELFFKGGINITEAQEIPLLEYPISITRKLKSSNIITDAYTELFSSFANMFVTDEIFKYIDIISLADSIEIEEIIVNRDNCSYFTENSKNFLKYGQSMEVIIACKNLLEVDIYFKQGYELKVARFTTRIEDMMTKKVF